MQSTPYVVLGVFLALGICLFIGAGIVDDKWFSLYVLIPSFFSVFFKYAANSYEEDLNSEGDCVTYDAMHFLLSCSLTSCLALPIVFYNVDKLTSTGLGFSIAGSFLFFIGISISEYLEKKNEL